MKYIEFFTFGIILILLLAISVGSWVHILNVGAAYAFGGFAMFISNQRNQEEKKYER